MTYIDISILLTQKIKNDIKSIWRSFIKGIGVLSNSSEFVNVFINNEFVGLYHLLGRLDESFLRNNKIMPGPIYTGDRLHKKWDVRDFDKESTNGILQDF